MKAKLVVMLAGIVLLGACKGPGSESADSVETDSLKLVKTADMHFKVKNVQLAAEQVSALVSECNGTVCTTVCDQIL